MSRKHGFSILCAGIALSCFAAAGVIFWSSNHTAYERMDMEESIADAYLQFVLENAENKPEEMKPEEDAKKMQYMEKETLEERLGEQEYYRWSPEYARGVLDCVLEYPELNIKRGIYKGAIENDLDCWMCVTANDSFELGKTAYTILGHNSLTFDVSLNALLRAEPGQQFTLTNACGKYEYEVTDIRYESREDADKRYISSLEQPSVKAYLITCGRYEHRYLDMIVEGSLKQMTLLGSEAEEAEEKEISEKKGETSQKVEQKNDDLEMSDDFRKLLPGIGILFLCGAGCAALAVVFLRKK